MNRLLSLISLFIFSLPIYANDVEVVFDDMFIDSANHSHLPIVFIDNGEIKDGIVYFSYNREKPTFIFTHDEELYIHVANALSNYFSGIELSFSCEQEKLYWCERYDTFDMHYDLFRSEVTVYYSKKSKTEISLETDPLLIVSNNVSYSYSKSRNSDSSSEFGFWSSDFDFGVSNNSSMHAGVRHDFSENKMMLDNARIANQFHWGSGVLYYNKKENYFSNFSANDFIGFKIISSKENGATDRSNYNSSVIVTAPGDGIFNIFNKYRELKQTTRSIRGLNKIELNGNDFDKGIVIIDIVQNGEVVETIERIIDVESKNIGLQSLAFGITNLEEKKYFFSSVDLQFDNINLSAGGIESHAYYLDASYTPLPGLRLSSNVEHQLESNLTDIETRISYSNSFYRWRYSPALMYRFGEHNDSASLNLSLSNSFNGYLFNLNYNLKKRWGMNKYSESDISRIDVSLSSTTYTKVAKVFWSTYATTDLVDDHGIGLNLTFTPSTDNSYLGTPTLNASYSRGKYQVRGTNELIFDESLTFSPEITMGQGKVDGYGVGVNFDNEFLNSDIGMYRMQDSDSLNINLYSNVYVSPYTVMALSEKKESQLVFLNNGEHDEEVELNVNGVAKKVKNGHVIMSDGAFFNERSERVYSMSEQVTISNEFNEFFMPKYRSKSILFDNSYEKIVLHGRVVRNGIPIGGASIVNHIGETISDVNGYFQLPISKLEPEISIYHNDVKCAFISLLDGLGVILSSEVFIGRLECVS